ncbi:MAG: hypothetical protein M1386_00970 [Candidatus Thermoplasmatota archaeon]|jgi:hypothetical protein|nr:hypothetical protein [Candidatus Thermoplasmatota archaeon]
MVKYLKCPECGFIFIAPLTDKKRIGFGFSPPGWGVVDCPNCKTEKPRNFYGKVSEEEFKMQGLSQ